MAVLSGALDIKNRLRREVKSIEVDAARVVKLMAFEALGRSKERTPVDTGNLRAGQYVAQADAAGRTWEVGAVADYAPEVHENLDVRRVTGNPKFLQNAIDKVASRSGANARFKKYLSR